MTMTRKRASTGVVRGLHLLICSPLHHTPSLPSTALAIVTVMVKLMLALMILATVVMTLMMTTMMMTTYRVSQKKVAKGMLREGLNGKKRFLSGINRMRGVGGRSTHAQIFWPFFKKCIFGQ